MGNSPGTEKADPPLGSVHELLQVTMSNWSAMFRVGSRLEGKDCNNSSTSLVGSLASTSFVGSLGGLDLAFDRPSSSFLGIDIGIGV